ncbi:hypothetical protein TNCV_1565511 [Trichonephila clavipes]|nr:hypothetical protein TNCV_1565511 [Trichonephila clavipes]
MMKEKLFDHITTLFAPKVIDYLEVKNPTTTAQRLQLVAKYEERYAGRRTQGRINNVGGQDWDSIRRVPEGHRDGNWRNAGVVDRQIDRSDKYGLEWFSILYRCRKSEVCEQDLE